MLAKLLKSFDQIGEPMCSLTKSAKIMAMVLVYGGNHESFTYSTKLRTYLKYIMDKYHIGGGEVYNQEFAKELKKYVKECTDTPPQWAYKLADELSVIVK